MRGLGGGRKNILKKMNFFENKFGWEEKSNYFCHPLKKGGRSL
jgi:hypothetical protein